MSDRRNFLKSLVAGSALAGLPPVKEVKTLQVTKEDAVVIRFQEPLSQSCAERIMESWTRQFPGVKLVILDHVADIEVLRIKA